MRTYVNKDSLTSIGVIFPILSLVVFSFRVYGWQHKTREFGIDDILIIPAFVSFPSHLASPSSSIDLMNI